MSALGTTITDKEIKKLVEYAVSKHLIPESERIYSTNLLLDVMQKNDFKDCDISGETLCLECILNTLCDAAVEKGLIGNDLTSRDLFDVRLMNTVMPRPSQIIETFRRKYEEDPRKATAYYYDLAQNTNYIRTYRVAKDRKWKTASEYGDIDITINLSKPEKDPKAIAAAKMCAASDYPKCLLCMENEGYAGHINHPARQNHRIVPIEISGAIWAFQYSPYVYYNEHCIVLSGEHVPMAMNRNTFVKLFDFVKQFPHYFLGSNADLPIVGGSILSHDHFQGGNYTFAMAKAETVRSFRVKGYEDVESGIIKWPVSVIRLRSEDTERLVDLANHILTKWREYTDEDAFIFAKTEGGAHNTVTPIARYKDGMYELDLALRNNITTEEHPLGVYHPHAEHHHIKKENIGLIEVMGLAVLPARLKKELDMIAECMLSGSSVKDRPEIEKHAQWTEEIRTAYSDITEENVMEILHTEVGKKFVKILENAGVFKHTEDGQKAFMRFIDVL